MAEKKNAPDRDATLVNILDRMAGHLRNQDMMLEEIVKYSDEFSKAMDQAEFSHSIMQNENMDGFKKMLDAVSRYRGDILSLVREQDHINKNISELRKLVEKSVYTSELNNRQLGNMDTRISAQEKSAREHYEHSLKQADIISGKFIETNRTVAKHFSNAEKRLGELHRETQRQLDSTRQDTARRLVALDGIEAALQTLLIRTEPPEKKPFIFTRLLKAIGRFFRVKVPKFFKRLFGRQAEK